MSGVLGVKSSCTGCRACEKKCPVDAINMEYDEEGFMYAQINQEKCIDCNICKDTCKKLGINEKKDFNPSVYAARNKDKDILKISSSGGIYYELAKDTLQSGGIVFGAVFDNQFGVIHKKISDINDLKYSLGSKYVQSDTCNTFSEVKTLLEQNVQVLYSGTPCQINGLKVFLENDYENLLCISLICHGVPSPIIWKKYLKYKSGLYDNQVTGVDFRDKSEGWKNFNVVFKCGEKIHSMGHSKELYFKGFLQNLFLRPSCYECKVKGNSNQSDIILGDYWGIEKVHPEFYDINGTSSVILLTSKAEKYFEKLKNKFEYIKSEYKYIQKYNAPIESSVKYNKKRDDFFKELYYTDNIVESITDNLKFEVNDKNKFYALYPVVEKYLERKISGWGISQYLKNNNYKNIVLYAITELTDFVIKDLQESNYKCNIYIADMNADMYINHKNIQVVNLKKLEKMNEENKIDTIIICNMFHENEIFKQLMALGISNEIIESIINILFNY